LDQSGFALLTDVPDVASELLGWLCACAAGGVVEPLLSVLRS